MVNIVEGGLTPELQIDALQAIGYSLPYPLTLLAAVMNAMTDSLRAMRQQSAPHLKDFGELSERVGFNDYYEILVQYSSSNRGSG